MPHRNRAAQIFSLTGTLVLGVINDVMEVNPGLDVQDCLILFAVVVGYFEQKPLTHSKLADYVGLPRPTVIRRVRRLVKGRYLQYERDGTIITPKDRLVGDRAIRLAERYARHIRNASASLSKMDTMRLETEHL